ncbi:hypothetical protein BH10PLA1_BH10PLA1_19500 [soil metagenome]
MTKKRIHPAFTLLELILVLAILTIVVAIVAPNFRDFTTGRATRNTATQILAMTHYARTQAVTQGVPYRLNYDSQSNTLWITMEPLSGSSAPANDFATRLVIDNGISVDTDIPQQQTGQYVEFHPSGRTDPAMIRLSDRTGSTIEIACSSATELFRILPPSEVTR